MRAAGGPRPLRSCGGGAISGIAAYHSLDLPVAEAIRHDDVLAKSVDKLSGVVLYRGFRVVPAARLG
jgi:hypothetical protein